MEQLRAIRCWLNPREWSRRTSFNLRMVSLICGNWWESPLPSGVHQPPRPPLRRPLRRLQQTRRRDQREQKRVDMIGHEHPRSQPIMAQFDSAPQRSDYGLGDSFLAQIQRTVRGGVQAAIHPHKGLAAVHTVRRRIHGVGETAVQMPGQEEPFPLRVVMRKAAARILHGWRVRAGAGNFQNNRAGQAPRGVSARQTKSLRHG